MRLPTTMTFALIAASRRESLGVAPWVLATKKVTGRLIAGGYVDEYRITPGGFAYYVMNDKGREFIGILEPS
jgi:hypothetical protein